MRKTMGERSFNIFIVCLLTLIALVTAFPMYYVLVRSFTDPIELARSTMVLFPAKWTLAAYQYILSTGAFIHSIGVSAFIAIVGTICSLAVSSSFAYTLSRKRMKGRRFLTIMVLITILFSPGIIPNYMLIRQLHLINSLWSVILPSLSSGWNIILMRGFFSSLPAELDEAAAIDGCNEIGIYFRIMLPLSLPALAAFGLFFAVGYWNTFFNALLYLNDSTKWPVQVLVQSIIMNASNTDLGAVTTTSISPLLIETMQMSAVVLATVPILLVYPFLQKHFAKGALIGSVKG